MSVHGSQIFAVRSGRQADLGQALQKSLGKGLGRLDQRMNRRYLHKIINSRYKCIRCGLSAAIRFPHVCAKIRSCRHLGNEGKII